MASFIYCIDEDVKNKFLSMGCKFIKTELMQDKKCWVLEYKADIKFDLIDKTKYFLSNAMRF